MTGLKVPVTTEDHMQGDPNAPVVLVEYGDYECPHCGRAHSIIKLLQRHFGDKLTLVFRNFPLNEVHPMAEAAAEAAEFAGGRGKFWEMHDLIFQNQSILDQPYLIELVQMLDLSGPELGTALAYEEYAPRVRSDFLGGVRSGVNGTPTFFINGERHDDSFELEILSGAIQSRL